MMEKLQSEVGEVVFLEGLYFVEAEDGAGRHVIPPCDHTLSLLWSRPHNSGLLVMNDQGKNRHKFCLSLKDSQLGRFPVPQSATKKRAIIFTS